MTKSNRASLPTWAGSSASSAEPRWRSTVLPTTLTCSADAMRVVKTNSSRWVHEQWPHRRAFAWQTGYGAFSVSRSNLEEVARYIANEEAHHRHVSFQEEFLAFLQRHGVAYDPKYVGIGRARHTESYAPTGLGENGR